MIQQRRMRIGPRGRITIPVDMREKFGFIEGDTVAFADRGNRIYMLHPEEVEAWMAEDTSLDASGEHDLPEVDPGPQRSIQ